MGGKTRTPPRLREYHAKRHFDRTPEPAGAAPARDLRAGHRFVIQKHAARRLHYDFRLEHAGVLLSWSVPKGPSLSPATRRLAVRTEDHPIEYADFEGVIPEGEYGGGAVVVWDQGTWKPEGDVAADLARGRLTFELAGDKLRGRWHLVRTKPDGKAESWLLFKGRDEAARDDEDIVEARPESVLSGRTIDEVRAARDRVWHSDRPATAQGAAAPVASAGDLVGLVGQLPLSFPLTNLDKVLYPEDGITKAAVIAYLAVVAEPMLAHVRGRPLTLVRCPDGRHKQCFYQKHAIKGVPAAIRRIEIAEEDGGVGEYMMVDDVDGLLATAQLGSLELHTWGARADKLERPDLLVFDLDPDTDLPWEHVAVAALEMRGRLADLGLQSFVKTTGGKGLHVVAPVARRLDWDGFKAFARGVAERWAEEAPARFTSNPMKARRKGKIYIDYLRNGRGATAIAPLSPRARPQATVATPLAWAELATPLSPTDFTITTVPKRLAELREDPWAGFFELRQTISAAARRAVGA
jgi:bifunctional non-homologous end joining protein LigD